MITVNETFAQLLPSKKSVLRFSTCLLGNWRQAKYFRQFCSFIFVKEVNAAILDSYLGYGFYKNEQKSWLTPNKC
jgi:hypothetical protein